MAAQSETLQAIDDDELEPSEVDDDDETDDERDAREELEREYPLTTEITLPDGTEKELRFRSLVLVPISIIRQTRYDKDDQMWCMFEWSLTPKSLALLDQMPASQCMPLLQKLQEVSQIALGESQASSRSSKSTVRRSKRTASTKG